MNTTTRAANFLQSLSESDTTAILDAVRDATRYGAAEPVALNVWATDATVSGITYHVLFSVADHTTTVLAVSLAEPP